MPDSIVRQFDSAEFGNLRVVTDNGEPWFVAKDVCDALEIQNTTDAMKRLDDDEKARFNLGFRGGDTNVVNEYGLYTLVLRSRKPEAKAFRRWVTHEVLPAIRRDGAYVAASPDEPDEVVMARGMMAAQRALERAREANRALEAENTELESRNAYLKEEVAEMRPKAIFADAVAASDGTCLVGELAKMMRQNGVDVGQNRLFERLRADGYLVGGSRGDRNMPTQRSIEQGLFRIKETAVTHSDGHVTISRTPKVTGKGQTVLMRRYCGAVA